MVLTSHKSQVTKGGAWFHFISFQSSEENSWSNVITTVLVTGAWRDIIIHAHLCTCPNHHQGGPRSLPRRKKKGRREKKRKEKSGFWHENCTVHAQIRPDQTRTLFIIALACNYSDKSQEWLMLIVQDSDSHCVTRLHPSTSPGLAGPICQKTTPPLSQHKNATGNRLSTVINPYFYIN